jgi:hypothetical protein
MAAPQQDDVELPQVVNLSQTDVENVRAELVRASQSTIHHLEAEEAEVNGVLIGTATTGKLSVRRTAIGAVQTQQAELYDSIVGGIRGETVSVNGRTGLIVATALQAEETNSVVLAGAEIHATNIRTGILFGRQVHGNIETVLDTRTTIIAGVIGGAIAGLVLLAGRLLFGKKK